MNRWAGECRRAASQPRANGQRPEGRSRQGVSEIIATVNAGLADSLIIAGIKQASVVDLDASASVHVRLKKAGVSTSVTDAAMKRATSAK
jgi:hypothetical protein